MKKAVLMALLSVCAAGGAWGEQGFDFESGVPVDVILREGANLTSDPSEVINGKASLKCDTNGSSGEWHEFLHTREHVAFAPNTTYVITFQYRILDPGDPKPRFYSMMKPRKGGRDLYAHPWMFTREKGARSHINRVFHIPDREGYYLVFGIRGEGAIVIDDIRIRSMPPNPYAVASGVRTFPTDVTQAAAQLEDLRREKNLDDLMHDMLVILCDEGSHDKARSQKGRLMRNLRPDFVDWSPIGSLAGEYGIRSSRGGIEYQEYYRQEGEEVWDRRFEMFAENGFDYTLGNMIIQEESWGVGGYFTTHAGTAWHEYFMKKLLEKAGDCMAICQDNISCVGFERVAGGFSPPELILFRHHLKDRYSEEELREWGIEDLESFSAQDYFLENGAYGELAWRDPLVREYIKFQYITHLLRWADVAGRVKEHGRKQQRVIPVYGNQINAEGNWPFAVAISQMCDVVEIEVLLGAEDEVPRRSLTYKTGLAGSHHKRPVWTRGPIVDDKTPDTPMLSTSFWTVIFGEALANGGVRDISLGVNKPWTGNPGTLDYIDDEDMHGLWKDFSDMLSENRSVFSKRESLAEVALVYSFPTFMFRQFRPLEIGAGEFHESFKGMAKTLEDRHVPYDVIIFGHPEIWDDGPMFERLKQYKAVMLPSVEAMTDAQADALKELAQAGGKVIFEGRIGIYDENMNSREKPALNGTRTTHVMDRRGVDLALRDASCVGVQVHQDATVNVWRSRDGGTVSVHLVDYNVDVRGERFNTLLNQMVKVRVDDTSKFNACYFIAPGKPRQEIEFQKVGNELVAMVPEIDGYSVIAFAERREFEAANQAATRRRDADRKKVMEEARRWNLY